MPSPVAHSLIGLTIGAAWLLPRAPWRELARRAWSLRVPMLVVIFAANAPDLDYLPGLAIGDLNAFHHKLTHTIPFVLLVTAALLAVWRHRPPRAAAWLTAIGLSHLAADMVTDDRRAPFGIPVLWPFSSEHWIAPFHVFWHLRKRGLEEWIQPYNFLAVGVEVAITLPFLIAVLAWKANAAKAEHNSMGP